MENFCKLSSIKPSFDSVTNSINCSFASQYDPQNAELEKLKKSNAALTDKNNAYKEAY